ncbi:MAG: M23 family metallopeptidase [Firmicutes bacterium]|nr:M23 family metallopeptidase [Bacillota bacterium]
MILLLVRKQFNLVLALVIILGLITNFPIKAAGEREKYISLNKQQLKQGELIIIRTENNQHIYRINFNQKKYHLYKDNNTSDFLAPIPISYWLKPGEYKLEINGEDFNMLKDIKIVPGNFRKSYLAIDSEKEEIIKPQSKETIERKKRDNQLINKARKNSSSTRLWQGKFIWPLDGTISTPFGAIRYVNDRLQSHHSGIDIAASRGTVVKAAASGIVELAAELLVTGNTIIIDHGWNISSSYSHLNDIKVSVGQKIEKGDIIGSVGSSGFSTGPHLHWAVKVNGVFANPEWFINSLF